MLFNIAYDRIDKNKPNATEKLYEEILSLPLYYALSDRDVEDVIEAVRRICA